MVKWPLDLRSPGGRGLISKDLLSRARILVSTLARARNYSAICISQTNNLNSFKTLKKHQPSQTRAFQKVVGGIYSLWPCESPTITILARYCTLHSIARIWIAMGRKVGYSSYLPHLKQATAGRNIGVSLKLSRIGHPVAEVNRSEPAVRHLPPSHFTTTLFTPLALLVPLFDHASGFAWPIPILIFTRRTLDSLYLDAADAALWENQ